MIALIHVFDVTLSGTLIWLAWRLMRTPDPFTAIVLFIAFGLLMAVVWVRLAAPDVALAEAAIGAGLTGALMLSALANISHDRREPKPAEEKHDDR